MKTKIKHTTILFILLFTILAGGVILAENVAYPVGAFESGNLITAARLNDRFNAINSLFKVSNGVMKSDGTNIGIGTSTPLCLIHIAGRDIGNAHIETSANFIYRDAEGKFQIISDDTGGSAAQILLSTTPINGNNKHWGIHHSGVDRGDRFEIGYGETTESGALWDLPIKMTILTNGNVGIGTSTPGCKLQVNGNAANTTGEWATISDQRLKDDISPLTNSLEIVSKLKGVSFKWRDSVYGEGLQRGFIAQDVELVLPEWVSTGADWYKRIETLENN